MLEPGAARQDLAPWRAHPFVREQAQLGLLGIAQDPPNRGVSTRSAGCTTQYAKDRTAFGQPISDYQSVSFPLAESAMDIYGGCRAGC
jgi:hypothetical protein